MVARLAAGAAVRQRRQVGQLPPEALAEGHETALAKRQKTVVAGRYQRQQALQVEHLALVQRQFAAGFEPFALLPQRQRHRPATGPRGQLLLLPVIRTTPAVLGHITSLM